MSQADEPFVNVVYLTATAGNADKLRDVMLETVGVALATPGNHGFSIHKSTAEPADFLIIERWDSDQALQADLNSAVVTDALARIADQHFVASGPSSSRWTRIT